MRQSTRNRRNRKSATTASAVARPEPQCDPDGTFLLCCSSGKTLEGNARNPTKTIYPQPITPPPDAWYADFNQDDAPNTLRIYRLDGDVLKDTCKYSFNQKRGKWNPPEIDARTGHAGEKGPEKKSWLLKLIKSLLALPALMIFKPLSFLAPLIRLLLWPIADFKWEQKINHRKNQLRLVRLLQFLVVEIDLSI